MSVIGSRADRASRVHRHAKYILFQCELMAKYKIVVWACQVGPFHLKLTQINSEVNCIAMHKCAERQKLDNLKEANETQEVRT